MLPIINRHINKRNGLVSTLFRTIQTSRARRETPLFPDLSEPKKFQRLLERIVENDTYRKRITENENIMNIMRRMVTENENMKRVIKELKESSRELKPEVNKQMPYKDEFDQQIDEWQPKLDSIYQTHMKDKDESYQLFYNDYNEALKELHQRLFNVLGGKIHQLETYLDKEHAVFGWAQILTSFDKAITLYLNTRMPSQQERPFRHISDFLGRRQLAKREGDVASQQTFAEMMKIEGDIERHFLFDLSLDSLNTLSRTLNDSLRNPAAHRCLGPMELREATRVLTSVSKQFSTPRLHSYHMEEVVYKTHVLRNAKQRDALETVHQVYETVLGNIGQLCSPMGWDEEEFKSFYEREPEASQVMLIAYGIDCAFGVDDYGLFKKVKKPAFIEKLSKPDRKESGAYY